MNVFLYVTKNGCFKFFEKDLNTGFSKSKLLTKKGDNMKKILILSSLILILSFSLVYALDKLDQRIITDDIGRFTLVDSDLGEGNDQESYVGTYQMDNPKSDAGFTRFSVQIIKPKDTEPVDRFNDMRGTLAGFGGVTYKIVKIDNQMGKLVWYSGDYLISIGPGDLDSSAESALDYTESLVIAYNEKYPSDVESRDQCTEIGVRREGTYCSDTGVYLEQKDEDVSCLNNYECKSSICIDQLCISSSLWQRFLSWFKDLFG